MSEIKTTNYYYVENIKVSEDVAKMYWKRLHKDYDNFYNTLIGEKAHPEMQMFGEQIKQEWETIPHLTVQKAFEEKNIEVRRLYFRAIGVAEMFQELEPTLIDKQVLEKEGITWDNDNKVFIELSDSSLKLCQSNPIIQQAYWHYVHNKHVHSIFDVLNSNRRPWFYPHFSNDKFILNNCISSDLYFIKNIF